MADQQSSAIPNRHSLTLPNSGSRSSLKLSFNNDQSDREYTNTDSESPGSIGYSPTSPVMTATTTITSSTTSTTTTQMRFLQPPRLSGRPRPPTLDIGLGSAKLQKTNLQLDLSNSMKNLTHKSTEPLQKDNVLMLNLTQPPSQLMATNNTISQPQFLIPSHRKSPSPNRTSHSHSLSPSPNRTSHSHSHSHAHSLSPSPNRTSSSQSHPHSHSPGRSSSHSSSNGVTLFSNPSDSNKVSVRSKKDRGPIIKKPSLILESNSNITLRGAEVTTKPHIPNLVLHLPPTGPHSNQPTGLGHHHHRHHHEGLRERTHKRDRLTRGIGGIYPIQSSGKLKISSELQVEFTADDLTDLGEIGRGGFGTVNKMIHRKTNTIMAVKRIRSTVDEKEQKELLMDLDVVMRSNECPCIVQFYGAIFKEGDCWICMELMDTSLDKFYKFIYERLEERLPESILGKITVATLIALNYLKEKLKIIHRDVKPSNILLDRRGNIKLCDFGISGQLVDSIAKTRDAGCRPYMAPERIDPARARGYDVRSDVWSLGITLMELATGSFPYPKWNSVFEQLTQVVQGEPPRLTLNENGNTFTEEFVNFVNTCLIKDEGSRPKYKQLLDHEFIVKSREDPIDVAGYICGVMDQMANNGRLMYTYDSYNY